MNNHQGILIQFDKLFRLALEDRDKVAMKSLAEAFCETWERIPLEARQATYSAHTEAWENTFVYWVTHTNVDEDTKQMLIRLLEDTTPIPI